MEEEKKSEVEKFIESADKSDSPQEEKPIEPIQPEVPEEIVKSNVYTIRTTLGRENVVLDFLTSRIKAQKIGIKSMMHPPELKGYIFIEGEIEHIQKAIQGIPHVRGLMATPVEIEKLQQFMQPKIIQLELNIGDIVEIMTSPFKGDKARVARVDKTKNEVTLELLEAGVPIPVKVNMEFLKVLERVGDKKLE